MPIFSASQKINQDEEGKYLILRDTSNYADNTNGVLFSDFISRKWTLTDINGVSTELDLDYTTEDSNYIVVTIDKDKYLEIKLTIATNSTTYSVFNKTGLTRQAVYKRAKIVESNESNCCSNEYTDQLSVASQLIDVSIYNMRTYDAYGYQEKIDSANTILDSIL